MRQLRHTTSSADSFLPGMTCFTTSFKAASKDCVYSKGDVRRLFENIVRTQTIIRNVGYQEMSPTHQPSLCYVGEGHRDQPADISDLFPRCQGVDKNTPSIGAIHDSASPQYRLDSYFILLDQIPPSYSFQVAGRRTSVRGYRLEKKAPG